MKQILEWLLRKPRVMIMDVAQDYGPRLSWPEVRQVFSRGQHDDLYRAVGQVMEFHRQLCQKAVEDKGNLAAGQTAFEAGAAAGIADVKKTIKALASADCNDPDLIEWFGGEVK